VSLVESYQYDGEGEYYAGYTVAFGEGSGVGCEGVTFREYFLITFDDASQKCLFVGYDGTNVPTGLVTDTPTTVSPTEGTTASPSQKPAFALEIASPSPSLRPTTKNPISTLEPPELIVPSFQYTIAPTVQVTTDVGSEKTLSPTKFNTRPIPTIAPMIQATPTAINYKTMSPTNSMPTTRPNPRPTTSAPVVDAPVVVDVTNTDTKSPTDTAVTTPMQKYEVSSKMVLSPSKLLDQDSKKVWINVTRKTIHGEAVAMIGIEPELVDVNVEIEDQKVVEAIRTRMLSRNGRNGNAPFEASFLRKLQSSSPLEIEFTTIIQFPSDKDDWDGDEMVASGFQTLDQQKTYINDLKAVDGSYFESLEKITLKVDNNLVTEPAASSGMDNTDQVGQEGGEGGGGDGNNTLYIIVAGVGGACILAFSMAMGVYYTRRSKRRKNNEKARPFTPTQEEQKPQNVGLEVEIMKESSNDPDRHCFGTIESKEGDMDDISEMETPEMGDAVNAGMDTDTVAGESMVSSQQEKYVYGIGRQTGGSTIYSGSNMKDTFGDDATFEDYYQTSPGDSNDGDSSFHRFTVVAPAGLLGFVLDNPNRELPIVHAIKERSALHGKIRVGDVLLSVDEVDCRGMTASAISAFLSSRSRNPSRTLELVRGS